MLRAVAGGAGGGEARAPAAVVPLTSEEARPAAGVAQAERLSLTLRVAATVTGRAISARTSATPASPSPIRRGCGAVARTCTCGQLRHRAEEAALCVARSKERSRLR